METILAFSDGIQGGSIERSLMDPSEGSTNTAIWAVTHMFLVLTSIELPQVELEILMKGTILTACWYQSDSSFFLKLRYLLDFIN